MKAANAQELARRIALALLIALVIVAAPGLLAGCGGGEEEDPPADAQVPTPSVDCQADPRRCA